MKLSLLYEDYTTPVKTGSQPSKGVTDPYKGWEDEKTGLPKGAKAGKGSRFMMKYATSDFDHDYNTPGKSTTKGKAAHDKQILKPK